MDTSKNTLVFFVNGQKIIDENVDPECTLLQYLRKKLRLTGSKNGCSEGGCGACTVMLSKYDPQSDKIQHLSINACLTPVCCLHGTAVTTVEGIGTIEKLHPVQERIAKAHGSQCGFCTPGFVMSMYTLLRNAPTPSLKDIEDNLIGNLCRCTGYRPIIEGFRTFSLDDATGGCGKTNCCQLENGKCNETNEENSFQQTTILFDPKVFKSYHPTQDIIFPPELKLMHLEKSSLFFKSPRVAFYRPVTLPEILELKQKFPNAKLIGGNTEIGVEIEFKNQFYPVLINISEISELKRITVNENAIEIGSAVSLSTIENTFKTLISQLPEFKSRILKEILDMLHWFAGRQVRNMATVGGNIMTGSPISDLNPIFMASKTSLKFRNIYGERSVKMDEHFYTSYRRNTSKPDEILVSLEIPFSKENEYLNAFKQARRREDDIAIVNAAFMVRFHSASDIVSDIAMAFGGMAPTTIMALNTAQKLIGQPWNKILDIGVASLLEELHLDPSAPGGMVDYRKILTLSFFFKFYMKMKDLLYHEDSRDISPLETFPPNSIQFFQTVPEGQEAIDPVGRPIAHKACLQQATGEAIYIDDIPSYSNELHAVLVTSTRSHAKLLTVDASDALELDGVLGFFSAEDIEAERNTAGSTIKKDEVVFASGEVHCVGQIIGVIVAETASIARQGSKMVKVHYSDISNSIITIRDAIKASSYHSFYTVHKGDPTSAFQASDHVLEGEFYMGGQEHFYMETNSHIAVPHETGEMEVFCNSQNLSGDQRQIASLLGVPSHKVVCKTKRIGGGFGGKETRTQLITAAIALAASKLKRPVRIVLNRHEDMSITGGRHPLLFVWKVGFKSNGQLMALDSKAYSNAGWSIDLSDGVLEKVLFNADNVYKIDNIKVTGYNCKTNMPSNTAFRGFGSPQGMMMIENIMSLIADYLLLEPKTVRELNFYQEGDKSIINFPIKDFNIPRSWKQVAESSAYEERKKHIAHYNSKNPLKKRGISILPTKFGIGFGKSFLNQTGALIIVYLDGSVLVTHGGVEMGQGLHTKMIQVTSREFQIPEEAIHISETSVDKVPNTSPSAASVSSDLCGMAIIDACNKINARLSPYKNKNPKGTWKDWVTSAYLDRVSLFAEGFFSIADVTPFDFEKQSGRPFSYFTFGTVVSEVEIDCLTGDHSVIRTDIVMDVGQSLNPAVDIGQIEGGFAQGLGLFTTEELLYSPDGALLTKGPGAYKLPGSHNIPRTFNVSLLRDSSNPKALYSSKAIGEPPLFLAASVFYAIKEAIKSYRDQNGKSTYFQFNSPATAERIRMACEDQFTDKIEPIAEGSFKPWCISV